MRLYQQYLTKNKCYIKYQKMIPKGIMVHSTGANNPNLKRYVQPDDGQLGVNKYKNDWNQYTPGGNSVCVHAFIGKLADGTVATYQTLPFDIVGWHSGSGDKGNANYLGYIGFEICEDNLTDPVYFKSVYTEAVEFCVYLCKLYNLKENDIICHSEGHKLGIASNHSDVMHWFTKHNKNMDTFRLDVRKLLNKKDDTSTEQVDKYNIRYNTIDEIPSFARDTIIKMINKGYLNGSGNKNEAGMPIDLDLSYDMLRVFIILDRAGTFG